MSNGLFIYINTIAIEKALVQLLLAVARAPTPLQLLLAVATFRWLARRNWGLAALFSLLSGSQLPAVAGQAQGGVIGCAAVRQR